MKICSLFKEKKACWWVQFSTWGGSRLWQSPKWVPWQGWVMPPPHGGWEKAPHGCNCTGALPDSTAAQGKQAMFHLTGNFGYITRRG